MTKSSHTSRNRKKPSSRGKRLPKTSSPVEGVPERTIAEVFASIDEIRKRVKPLPKGVTIKDLIEEGRT